MDPRLSIPPCPTHHRPLEPGARVQIVWTARPGAPWNSMRYLAISKRTGAPLMRDTHSHAIGKRTRDSPGDDRRRGMSKAAREAILCPGSRVDSSSHVRATLEHKLRGSPNPSSPCNANRRNFPRMAISQTQLLRRSCSRPELFRRGPQAKTAVLPLWGSIGCSVLTHFSYIKGSSPRQNPTDCCLSDAREVVASRLALMDWKSWDRRRFQCHTYAREVGFRT